MAKAHVLLGLLCIAFSLSLVDARKEVGVYEIKKGDFSIKLTNWGATVISVMLPDSQGLDFNYVGLFSLIYSQGFHSFIFFFFFFLVMFFFMHMQERWMMLFLDLIQIIQLLLTL